MKIKPKDYPVEMAKLMEELEHAYLIEDTVLQAEVHAKVNALQDEMIENGLNAIAEEETVESTA